MSSDSASNAATPTLITRRCASGTSPVGNGGGLRELPECGFVGDADGATAICPVAFLERDEGHVIPAVLVVITEASAGRRVGEPRL